VAVVVGGTVASGFCVAATDGACAGLLPQIYAGVGAITYALSGGRHTASGYGRALGGGFLVGTGAAACVLLCAEASVLLATVGGGQVVVGADVGAFDYAESQGPHNIGGYVKAAVIGAVENGPYPIERLFGGGS
jgi:hypothetical protein